MRIGFDTNSILVSHRSATTYLLELIPELVQLARPADQIVVFRHDDEAPTLVSQFRRQEQVSLAAAPLQKGVAGKVWRDLGFPALERLVAKSSSGPLDVMHCWNAPSAPSAAPHTLLTIDRIEPEFRLSRGDRRSLARTSTVIVPSRTLRDELLRRLEQAFPRQFEKRFCNLADRLEIIPPGVNARYHQPPKASAVEQLCERHPVLAEPYLLVVGGAADRRHNLKLAIAAYASAAREVAVPRLAVVAQPEHTQTVVDLLRQQELNTRSVVLENVANEAMPALYRGASFLLYPALDFAYGIAVLEAGACGVPAIVGEGCGAGEILGDATWRENTADALATEAWARAIAQLSHDPAQLRRRSEACRERAAKTTWGDVANQHWRLYRREP